jgi:hypothetical protein
METILASFAFTRLRPGGRLLFVEGETIQSILSTQEVVPRVLGCTMWLDACFFELAVRYHVNDSHSSSKIASKRSFAAGASRSKTGLN